MASTSTDFKKQRTMVYKNKRRLMYKANGQWTIYNYM